MADWTWDAASKRYRDASTGQYLSAASSTKLRDDFIDRRRADMDALTQRLARGDVTLGAWEREVQKQIRDLHTVEYAFGRGGRNVMSDADRKAVAEIIQGQYGYLRGFANDIGDEKLSVAQVEARARLYQRAATQSYERGRAAAFDVSLPAYPCDGSTPCQMQCRCSWSIAENDDEIRATWKLGPVQSEHCSVCSARASNWSPLVIAKSRGRTDVLYRCVA